MNLETFLSERTPVWEALEQDLASSRGRPERLGPERALRFASEYRATVADLALARRRYPGDPVVARLERLAAAGRQAVYSERSAGGSLREFALRGYWRLVAGQPALLAIALVALFGPCLLAAAWGVHDPAAALGLVPGRFAPAATPHIHRIVPGATTQAVLASSIFTNNIQVTLLSFAGGLALGTVTLAVLAFNGVLLGALAGITIQSGNFDVFVRYVVPHGILELSCIAVSGAAGLRLARAVLDPGLLPRVDALRAAARPAVGQVLGTAPWLVVAGLTEGFVTPHGLPLAAALAVGVALGVLYWTLVVVRGARGFVPGRAVAGATGQKRTRLLDRR